MTAGITFETRSALDRKDGRTWRADTPSTGSTQLVRCDDGTTGFVSVRWSQGNPQFFGSVKRPADFDAEGNPWASEIVDADPRF